MIFQLVMIYFMVFIPGIIFTIEPIRDMYCGRDKIFENLSIKNNVRLLLLLWMLWPLAAANAVIYYVFKGIWWFITP